jgi:eukaryotic-like serine/threonine-protein kinase
MRHDRVLAGIDGQGQAERHALQHLSIPRDEGARRRIRRQHEHERWHAGLELGQLAARDLHASFVTRLLIGREARHQIDVLLVARSGARHLSPVGQTLGQGEERARARIDPLALEYIVDVFDAGIDDATGMPFLVMELLNGEDLGKVLEQRGALPAEQVLAYLRQIASALDKTHAAGIVHRDLKPENLFLTHREDGTPRVKILDFGISKVVTEAQTGAHGGANATRGLGTPLYMAPEQVLAETISPATDLYALGLIAYSLLVGVPYWQNEAERFDNAITFVVHTSKGTTDSAIARAAQVGYSLPPAFDAWFRRATHLNPASRFRNAAELVTELALSLGIANPSYGGAPLGPDSTGSVIRSGAGVVVGATAETMIARTAPGTEFNPARTLTGGARRRRTGLWLGLVAAALAVIASVAVLALRAHALAGSAAAEAKASASVVTGADSALSDPERARAPTVSPVSASAAPVESSSAVTSAAPSVESPPARPPAAISNPAKAAANIKSASNKAGAAKASPVPAHAVQAPKYTRD